MNKNINNATDAAILDEIEVLKIIITIDNKIAILENLVNLFITLSV